MSALATFTTVLLGILLFILTIIVVAVATSIIQVITVLFVVGSYVDAHSPKQMTRDFSPRLALPRSLPDPPLSSVSRDSPPNVLHWVETAPDELPDEAAMYLSATYLSNPEEGRRIIDDPEGLGYDRRIEQEMWDLKEEYKNADFDRRQEMHDLALKRANKEEIARMEKQMEQAGKESRNERKRSSRQARAA